MMRMAWRWLFSLNLGLSWTIRAFSSIVRMRREDLVDWVEACLEAMVVVDDMLEREEAAFSKCIPVKASYAAESPSEALGRSCMKRGGGRPLYSTIAIRLNFDIFNVGWI